MSDHQENCKGCQEYNELSRRDFVGLSAGVVAAAAAPAWLPRVVYADSHSSSRDVMVSIFLRGGVDGLSMCVPFTENEYYRLRPTQAVPQPDSNGNFRAIDLDGFFAFPPSMQALKRVYDQGELLIVHACGLKDSNRSHFDAMHFMEVGRGNPPASLFTGWLGRHLAVTAPTMKDAVLRGVGISFGLQRSLVGGPRTLPINDLADFGFAGYGSTVQERQEILRELYAASKDLLKDPAKDTFRTIKTLDRIEFDGYKPSGGASYRDDEFGYALRSTAALIKADVGVEAVAIDLGGWDTHDTQGTLNGHMANLMETLADSLDAFHRDLEADRVENVVTVAMSEFGRNVFENGSAGTDHGFGGIMMAMGTGIAGGRVLTKWPGLDDLFEDQDLRITIDYRDVLAEILDKRMGNSDYRAVFPDPGFEPVVQGVTV